MEEQPIAIDRIFIYPIRGIRSKKEHAECWMCPEGIRYDREIFLMDVKTQVRVTNLNWSQMTALEQELIGDAVHVTCLLPERLGGLPKKLVIPLDVLE